MHYAEIQKNEVEALQAIYDDDFSELPVKAVWNRTPPPKFRIRLHPSPEFQEAGVGLDVVVAMTPTYPATLPQITVENANALHPKQLESVRNTIRQEMENGRGAELVFGVTTAVQALLDEYARSVIQAPSLEEDRRARLRAALESERRQVQRAEQAEKERVRREEAKFESLVLEQLEQLHPVEEYGVMNSGGSTGDVAESTTVEVGQVAAQLDSGEIVLFHEVAGNVPVPSNLCGLGHAALVRPIADQEVVLRLTRVSLCGKWWSSASAAGEVQALKHELDVVQTFIHPGIVSLLAHRVDRDSTGEWSLLILTPELGPPLAQILDAVGAVALRVARIWALQILEALEALHKAGIRHKYVSLYSAVLHRRGDTGESAVRLLHPSYSYRLAELNDDHPFQPASDDSPSNKKWPAPELVQGLQPTTKSDIWQFGVLLVQLLAGPKTVADAKHNTPLAFVKSAGWPAPVESFLADVFQLDPARRPAALELLTAEFLRSAEELSQFSESNAPVASSAIGFSRYRHDFDETAVLGRGGFGEVVKARNKLDGRFYAVKKVVATPKTLSHILQEVVLLSRLNHMYVVRYYTVWLESVHSQDGRDPNITSSSQIDKMPSSNALSSVYASGLSSSRSSLSPHFSPNVQLGLRASVSRTPSFTPSIRPTVDDDFIQFGYSDSSAAPSEAEQEPDTRYSEVSRPRLQGYNKKIPNQELYIQMEYCENHTLADVIKSGLWRQPPEYWRLLRQIVEALAYIHADGIIHRDLKPKNIFIDQARNVKIGDFGLARSVVQSDATQKAPTTEEETDDLTTEVGTTLYAAAELFEPSLGSSGYDEKVDMWSLGIIFFEMCFPMGTEMERVATIKSLRSGSVPEQFETKRYKVERQLVEKLLSLNPSERYSAEELLNSGKIPTSGRDLTIREALSQLVSTDAVHQLAQALFSRPVEPAQQVLYDRTDQQVAPTSQLLAESEVVTRIRRIFGLWGAVEAPSFAPVLVPRVLPQFWNPANTVQLLDQKGTVLEMPEDLILPHARRLAESVPDHSKSWVVGPVFRPSSLGSSERREMSHHPAVEWHARFSVVSTSDASRELGDIEAIAALGCVGAAICTSSSLVIGHTRLLESIFENCGLQRGHHVSALELTGHTGIGVSPERRRAVLASSTCSAQSLDLLESFAWREPAKKGIEKLKSQLGGVSDLLQQLLRIAEFAERLGSGPVMIAPLSHPPSLAYYDGVLMQLTRKEKQLAFGGRYDALVRHFRHSVLDRRTPLARAVGFWIDLTEVPTVTEAPGRVRVLVTSFNEATLVSIGVDLVRSLRQAGIAADLAHHCSSSEQLVTHAHAQGISFVVFVRHKSSHKPLRVKNLRTRADVDISAEELVSWVNTELGESTVATLSPMAPMSSISEESALDDATADDDLRVVILSEHGKLKGGRKNRWMIEENCRAAVQKFTASINGAPIVALDLRDDVISAITFVSPHSPEDWRRRVVGLAPNQKAYIMSVQSRLATESQRSARMLLFSVKTNNIFIYDT